MSVVHTIPATVLGTDAYAEFIRETFGLGWRRLRAQPAPEKPPYIEALAFHDAKGHLRTPPLTAFTPFAFAVAPRTKDSRIARQWVQCAGIMASDFLRRGVKGNLPLPSEVKDIRPWLWDGFHATLGYTYLLSLPHDPQLVDPSTRKKIEEARSAGFVCRAANNSDLDAIVQCLRETEERQSFSYRMSKMAFECALGFMGKEQFRIYLAVKPSGQIGSCRVVLHLPGGKAVDWIAATTTKDLETGVTQFLISYILQDLAAEGSVVFDFCGASIPGVSSAKAKWGGSLVSYPIISQRSIRNLALQCYFQIQLELSRIRRKS